MKRFHALAAAAMLAWTGPAFAEVANDAQTLALSNRLDNTTFARDKIEIGNRLA